MLDVISVACRRCDGVSRRDFLRVGALGGLGLSLPALLHAKPTPCRQRAARRGRKSVILVYLGGGLSHHDSFDPKPDAPAEIRGKYKPIGTCVPGLQIGEMLPRMAQVMDQIDAWSAPARTTTTTTRRPPTGCCPAASARRSATIRPWAPWWRTRLGFRGQLPPYVAVPRNPSFTWELGKSAYLGGRYESFKTGDPNEAELQGAGRQPRPSRVTPKRPSGGRTCSAAVDGLAQQVQGNDQIATYDEFHQRAATMILSSEARSAFAIEAESDRAARPLRPEHVRPELSAGPAAGRARRALRHGQLRRLGPSRQDLGQPGQEAAGVRPGLLGADRRHGRRAACWRRRWCWSFGEFGRTPKINKDAGRDHWGPAASLLFAGAGVTRGQVVGATDKQGGFATRRPVAPADVACTVYEALGIDPHKMLTAPDGRPNIILDEGETIKELYA